GALGVVPPRRLRTRRRSDRTSYPGSPRIEAERSSRRPSSGCAPLSLPPEQPERARNVGTLGVHGGSGGLAELGAGLVGAVALLAHTNGVEQIAAADDAGVGVFRVALEPGADGGAPFVAPQNGTSAGPVAPLVP